MVATRSSVKSESMSGVSKEIRDYFSELIKPLATNTGIKEMFDKLKEEILSKFETKIKEQDGKIHELESRVVIQEQTINNLLVKCDDNEQYSRRSCLRIHGIESDNNEKNDVIEKVRECYDSLNLPFNEEVIDSVHWIGKEYKDRNSGKQVKSIIVKFKSWKSRQQLYNARSRVQKDGKKKPRQNFSISVDLTRRRYNLLSEARGIVKDINAINFAFTDINCSLGIQGTSRDKIYQELGLESLKSRRWYKRLTCMFKIMRNEAPDYLINLVPKCEYAINTRNCHIPMYHCRTDCFKYSFLPSALRDWFKLDESIRNSESISIFTTKLLSFIRPAQSSIYNILDQIGIKLLTRLRLDFSNLNEHRFRYNFKNCLNPLCS